MKSILVCWVFGCSAFAQNNSAPLDLAQTEREFSKAAGLEGIKSAFLAYFDDESIMFYPQPVNGKNAIAAEPESPGSLVWSPSFVQVSASLDFGYTTGPSEYRQSKTSTDPPHYSHFVSVWKKDREGKWKIILDVGNSYCEKEKKEEELRLSQISLRESKKGRLLDGDRHDMLAADSEYSAVANAKGSGSALEVFGSQEVRVYRRGKFPVQGRKNGSMLVGSEKFLQFRFGAGQISSAGDLGFTYGTVISGAADTCNYIRIWRRENKWKVAVDVLSPWARKK